ncbi:Glycoside hydrolase [Macleaya cordata]|uniref:Glycoside hydrolase n=1 Tax=Macleaya cordata TaxID=56857 RepID=A0A200QFV6_MACCD|nr:Glycoside hydrolase [Macleaya cordata]
MNLRPNLGSICLLFLSVLCVSESADFNVVDHGATPDGIKDSTEAFVNTWKEACASEGSTTFVIPQGSFLVGQVNFKGPCKGNMNVLVQGNVKADPDPAKFPSSNWIVFEHMTGLQVSGGGVFDGQGSIAWTKNDCSKTGKCHSLPINIRFNFIENAFITHITSLNSKLMHININGCKNITLQSVKVTAPGNSLNTDGIHIGSSKGVNITDSVIATGDDCVSMGPGSVDIKVTGVTCGPGHGISVGSLGKYPNEESVSGITVRNCTLIGTSNGVRIKTWPKSPVSAASGFIFEDIVMDNVQNPIIIDQVYCPYVSCSQDNPSKVKISNVSFNKIRGTSATKNAVSIVCSKGVPCEDVKIGDIDLKYTGKDGPAASLCNFAKPILTGVQNPPIAIN